MCQKCKMMGLANRCGSPSWLEGDDSFHACGFWVRALPCPSSVSLSACTWKGCGVIISCASLGCASWGRCALVKDEGVAVVAEVYGCSMPLMCAPCMSPGVLGMFFVCPWHVSLETSGCMFHVWHMGTCSRSALLEACLGTPPASWTPPPGGGHHEGECGQGPGAGPEAVRAG